jgi:glycosyltransferase involved in cell wall biosynthesis
MTLKRVLLVSYLFPPCGESGVQRNLKYAKYLPGCGWQPYILTTKEITYHVYDYSILSDIPKVAVLIRAGSFDPHRLSALISPPNISQSAHGAVRNANISKHPRALDLYRKLRDWIAFPDANMGWIPFAFQKGIKAIRENKIDIIIGSVGPYTSAILSKMLSKKTGIPYVLDFRDGWIDDPYLIRPTPLHKRAHSILERSIVAGANGVCVYGDYLYQQFAKRYPQLIGRMEVLTNGFDSADCEGIEPAHKKVSWRRIVFCGSLYEYFSPHFIKVISALRLLPEDILNTLEIVFVGRNELCEAQKFITAAGLNDHIKLMGYMPHHVALSYLISADASLLLLPIGDIQSYSGKIFEYLMIKKPIVACIEPEGTCAALLRRIGQADWIAPPANAERLCEVITLLAKQGWPQPSSDKIDQFNRKRLTERLAAFLKRTIERHRLELYLP